MSVTSAAKSEPPSQLQVSVRGTIELANCHQFHLQYASLTVPVVHIVFFNEHFLSAQYLKKWFNCNNFVNNFQITLGKIENLILFLFYTFTQPFPSFCAPPNALRDTDLFPFPLCLLLSMCST